MTALHLYAINLWRLIHQMETVLINPDVFGILRNPDVSLEL